MRRALALALAACLALSGCFGDPESPPAGPTGAAEPTGPARAASQSEVDTLAAAARALDTARYEFRLERAGGTLTGRVDGAAGQAEFSYAGPNGSTVESRTVGDRRWVRLVGVSGAPTGWLRLDPARLSPDAGLGLDDRLEPAGVVSLVKAATGVTVAGGGTGAGRYAGTVDLTRAYDSDVVTDARVTALGDAARAVPFEARLDDAGRLVSVTLKVPERTVTVTYTPVDQVTVAAPEGKLDAAPASIYALLVWPG
jgi:hypothetical protein